MIRRKSAFERSKKASFLRSGLWRFLHYFSGGCFRSLCPSQARIRSSSLWIQKRYVVSGVRSWILRMFVWRLSRFQIVNDDYRYWFPDIRQLEHVPGRSINLAMSVRGLSALNSIGLGAHVASEYGIPMHARMIHTPQGQMYPVPYGKEGEAIYSVGRRYVNEILLTGNYLT